MNGPGPTRMVSCSGCGSRCWTTYTIEWNQLCTRCRDKREGRQVSREAERELRRHGLDNPERRAQLRRILDREPERAPEGEQLGLDL